MPSNGTCILYNCWAHQVSGLGALQPTSTNELHSQKLGGMLYRFGEEFMTRNLRIAVLLSLVIVAWGGMAKLAAAH
jgi:hypothetical protein